MQSHWHHHFYDLQYSSSQFYTDVENTIRAQQLPHVRAYRLSLFEGGILSSRREYLRIVRFDLVFDVCASPFGKEFFISWWSGESSGCLPGLLSKIPIVGRIMVKENFGKTYYQMDTEIMFKESIHHIILLVIDSIASQKGITMPSKNERLFKEATV